MAKEVLPTWAKDLLIGQTVESATGVDPHTLSVTFRNGTILSVVGMPFADGTLDVSVIEGTGAFVDRITK